jgi:hypothetical protein
VHVHLGFALELPLRRDRKSRAGELERRFVTTQQMRHRGVVRHRRNQLNGRSTRIVEKDVQRVGNLGGRRSEVELTAEPNAFFRVSESERLDNSSDSMHEQIARDAARVIPIPPPELKAVGVEVALRSGAEPSFDEDVTASAQSAQHPQPPSQQSLH